MNFNNDIEAVESLHNKYIALKKEIHKKIIGQEQIIDTVLLSIFSRGHCLLVGVPGLAKTLLVTTIAESLGLKNNRIQFTPDLMPSDIVGTEILDKNREFSFIKGAVFTNFLLADEINRTPPKTQAALLEAMQEHAVTASGKTYQLEEPFFVLATQNPIEQEGTYPLPEAQVDRFMLKLIISYPQKAEEQLIIRQNLQKMFPVANKIISSEAILRAREVVTEVYMDEKIEKYIVDLVFATRFPEEYNLPELKNWIAYGCSPRAGINLAKAAKAYAFIKRRGYVIPEDIRTVCHSVLRHRIGLTYEAEAENITSEDIVTKILNAVDVP